MQDVQEQKKPAILKKDHPALQNIKISIFFSFFVGHLLKIRAVLLLILKNPGGDSQIPSFSLEKHYCRLRGTYLSCVSIVYRYRIIVTEILSN
jgi:hypothetical protein